MLERLLLVLVLVLVPATAATTPRRLPVPTWTAGARRYAGDDHAVAMVAYAGRAHHHPIAFQVRWPEAPAPAALSELWLAASDKLFQHEASDDVDHESPLGDPQLTLVARGQEAPFRLGTSLSDAATALATLGDEDGAKIWATAAKARGILSLAWPNTSLWARYQCVDFTGSRLIFSGTCNSNDGHGGVLPATGASLWLRGRQIASNLTLVWSPDSALTTVPVSLYLAAVRDGGDDWALHLLPPGSRDDDRRLLLATASQVRNGDAPLLAADPDPNSTTIRIGRRVAAELAIGWTALPGNEASGWTARYGVHWVRPLDDATRNIAAVLGLVLAFLLGYLASHLLRNLRLLPELWRSSTGSTRSVSLPTMSTALLAAEHGDDTPDTQNKISSSSESSGSWRPFRQAWIVLIVGTAAHILAIVCAGRGVLIDVVLVNPLHDFAVALGASSIPLALLLAVELGRALRRGTPVDRSPWTAIAFAAVHSAVVARSLVATMLVAAGTSMFALVMTTVTCLITVLFPSIYAALLLGMMTLARPSTDYRRHRGWRIVWYSHVIVAVATAAVNSVAAALWLVQPVLDLANTLYPDVVVAGAVWWLLIVTVLAALVLVAYEQLQQTEQRLAARDTKED